METPWIIYGTAWKKERTTELVRMAVQSGFRAIDTANQFKHYREDLVGKALEELAKEGIQRENLFLQTKFTPIDSQDTHLPYDPSSSITEQVEQSFQSSLEHLRTDYLDSYLLHGPYHYPGLGEEDWEVWAAIEKIYASGKVKQIGVSNFNALQLKSLLERAKTPPMMIQNRCYANRGWDHQIREIAKEYGIRYQGFSLLTANPGVVGSSDLREMAESRGVLPEQIIFAFANAEAILPLTGTTQRSHMLVDLKAEEIELTAEEIRRIQKLS